MKEIVKKLAEKEEEERKKRERIRLGLQKKTALHIACDLEKVEKVQSLLAAAQEGGGGVVINVDEQDEDGWTPLHIACMRGNLKIVELLTNANVEVQDNKFGFTPLHDACANGHNDIIRFLVVERKANINALDNGGGTTRHSVTYHRVGFGHHRFYYI